MQRKSIYQEFEDAYGDDPIRRRYGISDYDVNMELERRKALLANDASEAALLGQELQNTKLLTEEAFKQRERVLEESHAADALRELQDVDDPKQIVSVLSKYPRAVIDPTVKAITDQKFKAREVLNNLSVKATELGTFPEFKEKTQSGQDAVDAFATANTERSDMMTRSTLEGLDIPVPENRSEMLALEQRARAMEPDPALRQSLVADRKMYEETIQDPMSTDEEKAEAERKLQGVRDQLQGARALGRDAIKAYINQATGR